MSSISNVTAGKRNFKIVLLGDSGVGKTALIERFVHNRFETKECISTIGIDFVGKNIQYKGQTYRLQLWDTAGQERYRSLIPSYLKDAIGAIFVFDITNHTSLQNLESWITLFKQNREQKSYLVICGNKSDLAQSKSFDLEQIHVLMSKYHMKFSLVSALNGASVNEMFNGIIELAHSKPQGKKKRFDNVGQQYEGISSSQNIHKEDLNTNLSNNSQKQKYQESIHQNRTKITAKNSQNIENLSSVGLRNANSENKEIQGGNRCC